MIKAKDVSKLTVNKLTDGFWLVPPISSIFTKHQRKFLIKKYSSLSQLIDVNDLQDSNVIFSFNGDKDFSIFNSLMSYRNYNFSLSVNKVNALDKGDWIDYEIVHNLIIRFNFQTIKTLYSGYLFFFTKSYFLDMYKKNSTDNNKLIVNWTKKGFNLVD